jgi:hypothetical protein
MVKNLGVEHISDEDDFLRYYLQNHAKDIGQFFPKVHTISTLPISPDIDLLYVDSIRKVTVGHEFKLLRYIKNWKRVNYAPLYAGIGEALLYFNFGVDQCYLILGFAEMPSELVDVTIKKIEQALEAFNTLTQLFKQWSDGLSKLKELVSVGDWIVNYGELYRTEGKNWGFGCFGVKIWSESGGLKVIRKAEQLFPIDSNSDLKHKNECLLRGEFKYEKKLLHT